MSSVVAITVDELPPHRAVRLYHVYGHICSYLAVGTVHVVFILEESTHGGPRFEATGQVE